MKIRSTTRVLCRSRKIRVITMTHTQFEMFERLDIPAKNYFRAFWNQRGLKKLLPKKYKFGEKNTWAT